MDANDPYFIDIEATFSSNYAYGFENWNIGL
jgi:hypothetical protein